MLDGSGGAHDIDYRNAFLNAPVGLCISDDRVIISANIALDEMFGYGRGELDGMPFAALYPSRDEFVRTGKRIIPMMNDKGRYADERIMRHASGQLFWCRVSGRALDPARPLGTGIWAMTAVSTDRAVPAALTAREREVAALLLTGSSTNAIAGKIGLSPRTVEMHRASLMRKFGATTAAGLVSKIMG